MNWIEGFFVRAKHWQLFFLFLATFAATEFMAFGSFSAAKKSPEEATTALLLMATLTGLGVLCFLLWLWSVGSFLRSILQPAFRLRTVFSIFGRLFVGLCLCVRRDFPEHQRKIDRAHHSSTSVCNVLHLLLHGFRGQESGHGGERQARNFLRLCGTVLSCLVLFHWRVVYPAADQSALCGKAERPGNYLSCGGL
jgi:hypothetical protein